MNEVNVTIGGIPANTTFAGLTPGLIGFYQINVSVPNGVTADDRVPVTISQGDVAGNTATIAVR